MVPRPTATLSERVLANSGRRPSKTFGSSSYGSRFTSRYALGKNARSSGAPRATHGRNNSSTKASSDRRNVSGSSREAARKRSGYVEPECGELKISGEDKRTGSTVSIGRSKSDIARRSNSSIVSPRARAACSRVPLQVYLAPEVPVEQFNEF